jgi:GntR family transcriptional repressor for pyruvate dehydrogenase complex
MAQNVDGERRQLRRPRLADIIAGSLRDRILSGELHDGSSLPTLERMVQEYGVSSPSVREALRILET